MSHQSQTWYDILGNLLHMLLVIALSLIKPCDPRWETYHALKTKIMYTPHIPAAHTLGVRKNMFSIHPKLFYSYIGNRHKNMLVRINAPSSCKCLSWKVLITEREAHGSSLSSQQYEQIARPRPASFSLWETASSLYQWSLVVSFPHLLPDLFVFLLMVKVHPPIAFVLFLLYG
jgi:hypothetical protein